MIRMTLSVICITVTHDPVYVGMHLICFRLPVLQTRMAVDDDGCHIAQLIRKNATTITPTHKRLLSLGGAAGRSTTRAGRSTTRGCAAMSSRFLMSFKSGSVPFTLDIIFD